MDKKYSIGINVLLKHLSISSLLRQAQEHKRLEKIDKIFPIKDFVRGCQIDYPHFSYNECDSLYKKLFGALNFYEENQHGVFSLFHKVANEALRLDGSGFSCKHEQMLPWREAVHAVGQSVFICAFLAYEDHKLGNRRVDFSFAPFAASDNTRLRNMLYEGMAENHFHLKGSAPTFLMSWICLMNWTENRNTKHGFKNQLMKHRFFRVPEGDDVLTLWQSTVIASYLRIYLNRWLDREIENNGEDDDVHKYLLRVGKYAHLRVGKTQRMINAVRMMKRMELDYAANRESFDKGGGVYAPISGENRFLYRMFRAIYDGNARDEDIKDIYLPFFVYLMAFVRLRAELVQTNLEVGFQNFSDYQDRKELFLDEKKYRAYKNAFIEMGIDSALAHESIKSLEVRYVPNGNFKAFSKMTKDYYEMAAGLTSINKLMRPLVKRDDVRLGEAPKRNKEENLFFVAHFVKRRVDFPKNSIRHVLKKYATPQSRHHRLQTGDYARQAESIIRLRRLNYELPDKEFAGRLYGIDAANHEFFARPEVFGFLFRKMRYFSSKVDYSAIYRKSPRLRITYHAGEDFFDIASGLRAINEAVEFLELGHGDRLGHALALGVDPADFYRLKGRQLFIPRQELLDNAVWMIVKLRRYGLFDRALEHWLEGLVVEHFRWLYRQHMPLSNVLHTVNIEAIHNAWHLRGDNPKFYKKIDSNNNSDADNLNTGNSDIFMRELELTAETYDLMQGDFYRGIREKDVQARQLMHHYHYNWDVRQKGEEIVEIKVPADYAAIMRHLQDAMLGDVCRKGIGIETNPSSNYLIGTFRRYDKHPIIRFYNRELVHNSSTPQAFVSINTDNNGVFDTDLENEYALMASALENAADDDGHHLYHSADILSWLNAIRKMGLEQSFMLTHKNLLRGRAK